jgi:SAM-dependent methyltransferase
VGATSGRVEEESAPTAVEEPQPLACRLCGADLQHTFADLGVSPLANSYLSVEDILQPEPFYPLRVYVCDACFLVQLPVFEPPERIFGDYAYFSSYSDSWLDHCRRYADDTTERFGLDRSSRVIEVASNDGYLLQFFQMRGISVRGIEPARNVAEASIARGIPTITDFFGSELAQQLAAEGEAADLLIGNNVLAHVPDPHDFVEGLKILLAPDGLITMEFPHLLRLIDETQFDTIYHEHFSYFSLLTAERLFREHELTLFDVEELPTHGGSLRIYARHAAKAGEPTERLSRLRVREEDEGLARLNTYLEFDETVRAAKRALLSFLIDAKQQRKSVVAYGAAAKGVTLLNYCGVRTDFVDYVVDRSPHKQGRYLPGVHIPIHAPDRVAETRPDYLLILPWNIRDEIVEQMSHVREFGCRFVVPVPQVEILE